MTVMKNAENSWRKGIGRDRTTSTDIMNSIYQSRISYVIANITTIEIYIHIFNVCLARN